IVGRDDGPEDWRRLREAAAADPGLWAGLGDSLEDDMVLRCAIAARPEIAVPLPPQRMRRLPRAAAAAAGWIAAALLAALWVGGVPAPLAADPAAEPLVAAAAEPDIVELGELPRMVVSTGEVADDGSVELVY